MAAAGRTRNRLRRNWIAIAFLILVVFIGARWGGRVATHNASDDLDRRLGRAGTGTNNDILDTERKHLAAVRAFSFTAGVPEALAELDIATVTKILTPVDANQGIPMVDVLDPTGKVVFAFRADGMPPPIYRDRGDIGIVSKAVAGIPDELGTRFSTLLVTEEGPLIASVGAVKLDDRIVGAVLVMTPLHDVLAASAAKHGAYTTVYTGTAGVPLATTAPVKPRTLPELLHHLLPADNLPVRSEYDVPGGTAREQLGSLVVRNQPVAWLGVAEIDRTGEIGTQIVLIALLSMLAVIALAIIITVLWRRDSGGGDDVPSAAAQRDADELTPFDLDPRLEPEHASGQRRTP